MISVPGLVNLDFADVRNVMENRGSALIGIGIGYGENRAIEAAKQAVNNPLLETAIGGATDCIINITGGNSLTLFEAEDAAEVIRAAANTDVNIIFGAVVNDSLTDEVIVTVIATGFEEDSDPLYHSLSNNEKQIVKEETDDEIDIPSFLRNRDF